MRRFAPRLQHGDDTVLQVQHWLQVHYATSPAVATLAARARVGERTFLRRFRQATGLTPTGYLQHLRVEKAREALELSSQSISEIAWMVGRLSGGRDPGHSKRVNTPSGGPAMASSGKNEAMETMPERQLNVCHAGCCERREKLAAKKTNPTTSLRSR